MKKGNHFKGAGIAAVVLLFAGGASFGLPKLLETSWEARLSQVSSAEKMEVTVQAVPPMKLLWGSADRLLVNGENMRFGKMNVTDAHLRLTGVSVNVWESLLEGTVSVSSLEEGTAEVALNEENLQTYLEQQVPELKNPTVKITKEGIRVSGMVKLFGTQRQAVLQTAVETGADGFILVPQNVEIGSLRLSGVQAVYTKEIPLLRTGDFPFQLIPKQVIMEEGKIIFYASVMA